MAFVVDICVNSLSLSLLLFSYLYFYMAPGSMSLNQSLCWSIFWCFPLPKQQTKTFFEIIPARTPTTHGDPMYTLTPQICILFFSYSSLPYISHTPTWTILVSIMHFFMVSLTIMVFKPGLFIEPVKGDVQGF